MKLLYRLLASERGANIMEYTLLISFIALAAMFALAIIGKATTDNISPVLDHL